MNTDRDYRPSTTAEADAPASRSIRVRVGPMMLHAVEWGDPSNPVAVLVHGAAAHARWWDDLVPALVSDWRLVALDLRGHGESDWAEPPSYHIEDFGEDVRLFLESYVSGAVVLIGHSMGGRACAWLTAHHPRRVRGLALLDSRVHGVSPEGALMARASIPEQRQGRGYPTRAAAMGSFRLIPEEPGVPAPTLERLASHAVYERAPGEWALRFDRATLALEGDRGADLSGLFALVRCPSLLLYGEESTVTTRSQRVRLAAQLPEGAVRALPGGHHFLLSHPAPVAAALRDFLDGLRDL